MKSFFSTLYDHCDGMIEIRTMPAVSQQFFSITSHEEIHKYVNSCIDINVFFGVATRDGEAGTKKNIIEIPTVWCDADLKDITAVELSRKVEIFPFKPSIIVLTGGGAHLYWLLTKPVGKSYIEMIEDVNRRIAYALSGDKAAVDAARILRVPGTLNHKYNPPQNVKLHRIHDYRYDLDDFLCLPEPPVKARVSKRSPLTLDPVNIGARNNTLTRIVGKYIGLCMDYDEVLTMALGWNLRCPEPQPIEDVIATVNSIIKADNRNNKCGDPNNEKTKRIKFSIV